MKSHVAIIGAGLGGLSAAVRLAAKGSKVSVFEQSSVPGGKMGERRFDGFRFDTGPSVLTMPFVVDALFSDAGFRREDFLIMERPDPSCRYFFPDGSQLDMPALPEDIPTAMEKFSPGSGDAGKKFLDYSRELYRRTTEIFLNTPIHEPAEIFSAKVLSRLPALAGIDAFSSVHSKVSRFFDDPRLQQLFDRYATYNGSNPYRAPATLNVIPYVELAFGAWYIKGGMYTLARSLFEIAQEMGVVFHFNSPVEKIIHDGRAVHGLLVNEETNFYDAVLCNADSANVFRNLIDGEENTQNRLDKMEPGLSGMVFLWGLKGKHKQLKHHNILFSKDYKAEFDTLFKENKPPQDPTVYIAISSKSDPNHAPDGHENWFVMVNMPHINENSSGDEIKTMRTRIIRRLKNEGLDVMDKIEKEDVITPRFFKEQLGANAGSIYGFSSNTRSSAFRRPANRYKKLKGLYFAGGSAHPGGGIPLVLLSGKHAANLVSDYLRRNTQQPVQKISTTISFQEK